MKDDERRAAEISKTLAALNVTTQDSGEALSQVCFALNRFNDSLELKKNES